MFFVVSCASGQNFPSSTIERMKQAVVPIVCVGYRVADKSVYLISVEGSGFFVREDGDIVTAGHVAKQIFAHARIPVCDVQAIYAPINGWNASNADLPLRVIQITKCWWSDEFDIATCALEENPFTSAAIKTKPLTADFANDVQKDGTPVAFTGFPLSTLQPITSQGTVAAYRGVIGDAVGPRELIVDKNAWPGASGSPIYTSSGEILGLIVERGTDGGSGLAYGRTSAYIKQFLSDNKIKREKEKQDQQH